jgi:hypothetical protein
VIEPNACRRHRRTRALPALDGNRRLAPVGGTHRPATQGTDARAASSQNGRPGVTQPRKRTRASAKAAGARFERHIADHLAKQLDDDRIDRRVKNGAKDRGDIAGLRAHGQEIVAELKDCTRWDVAGWLREAETERGNADALAGVVIAKRRNIGDPGQALVMCTVDTLIALITGRRPEAE